MARKIGPSRKENPDWAMVVVCGNHSALAITCVSPETKVEQDPVLGGTHTWLKGYDNPSQPGSRSWFLYFDLGGPNGYGQQYESVKSGCGASWEVRPSEIQLVPLNSHPENLKSYANVFRCPDCKALTYVNLPGD